MNILLSACKPDTTLNYCEVKLYGSARRDVRTEMNAKASTRLPADNRNPPDSRTRERLGMAEKLAISCDLYLYPRLNTLLQQDVFDAMEAIKTYFRHHIKGLAKSAAQVHWTSCHNR